jgi:hypothetical protein
MLKKGKSEKLEAGECEGRAVMIIIFSRLEPEYRFIISFCLLQNSVSCSPDNLLSLPDT